VGFCIFALYSFILKQKFTMGRGDNRTKKGKITNGTFGVSRPDKVKKTNAADKTAKTESKKA
jgi:30S ribosomal protein S31